MDQEEFDDWMTNLKRVHDEYREKNTKVKELVDVQANNSVEEDILDHNVHSLLNLHLNQLKESNTTKFPFDISLE